MKSERKTEIELRIDPLRDEDVAAWVELINEADAVDELGRATTVERAQAKLSSPGYGADHVLLAWHHDRLVGYGDLWVQSDGRAIGGVTVHPRWRRQGIGRRLLSRVADLAVSWGIVNLDLPIVPRVEGAVALARAAGAQLARYWWEMVWMGRERPPRPQPPPGITLRTFDPARDRERWIELDAAAFDGHWGAAPLTLADVDAIMRRPGFAPAGLWFAEDHGKLVGQALAYVLSSSSLDRLGPVGQIEDVAVLPAYRGRGIGRALLLAAMGYLWERGCRVIELTVDTENVGARRLYDESGFFVTGQLHWYRLRLSR